MKARTPDTSVVVAGLSSWHPDHETARPVLSQVRVGIAHVIAESYSVLTRLPHGQRIPPDTAWRALSSVFDELPIVMRPSAFAPLFARLAESGVVGGATYDALVAETARSNEVELVSFDQRAARTYEFVGADFVLLETA